MEETGVVKEIIGERARVTVIKQGSCDTCPAGSLCKAAGDAAEIEAINKVDAHIGDTVKIFFKPYSYLKGTALIYGIPAVSLIIGAMIGKEFMSKFFPHLDPEIVSAICAFTLFGVTLIAVKIFTMRYEGKKQHMPVIEEIIKC
ncbi:MAG: SoxR reducing system RseC family protein [Dissulfurispiraceae bacterium]